MLTFTQREVYQSHTDDMIKDAGKSLVNFTDNVRIPECLITEGATDFTGKHMEFIKESQRMQIMVHTTERGRKNQNHASECKNQLPSEVVEITDDKEEGTNMAMGLWTQL